MGCNPLASKFCICEAFIFCRSCCTFKLRLQPSARHLNININVARPNSSQPNSSLFLASNLRAEKPFGICAILKLAGIHFDDSKAERSRAPFPRSSSNYARISARARAAHSRARRTLALASTRVISARTFNSCRQRVGVRLRRASASGIQVDRAV